MCCVWLKDIRTVWKTSIHLSRYSMSECVCVSGSGQVVDLLECPYMYACTRCTSLLQEYSNMIAQGLD